MAFCTPEGANSTEAKPRVYKTHGPQSQRETIVLLYLCYIVIPLLEAQLSSSNIIMTKYSLWQTNKKQFLTSLEPAGVSYTVLEINQHWERSR